MHSKFQMNRSHSLSRKSARMTLAATSAVVAMLLGASFTFAQTAVEPSAAPQEASPKREPGISARFYQFEGKAQRVPTLVEGQTPNVSIKIDKIDLGNDEFGGMKDRFISELSGFITPPKPGVYGFRLSSDDGSVLTIDGRRLIDNDGLHDMDQPGVSTIELGSGEHSFIVRHFDQAVDAGLRLEWKKPGETKFEVVPASAFTCPANEVRVTAPGAKRVVKSNEPPTRPGDRRPLLAVHPGYDLVPARPEGFEPKIGGIDFLADGRMVVCTWDPTGAVYIVDNWQSGDSSKMTAKRFAAGLAEPLGLRVVGDRLFVLQKQELTELIDHDKDGVCDEYRCISSDWNVTGNFHEFAFGLPYKDGNFYIGLAVALNPGGKTKEPQVVNRGCVLKINAETGKTETFANGLRTPNGLNFSPDGELFLLDNQGDWLPSSKLLHIQQGHFYNNHIVPDHPNAKDPVTPPVVWLPQNEIGNSPSEPLFLTDGPYKGQVLFGDVTHGGLNRVYMDKVNGQWQGVAFQFTQGFEGGVNRARIAPDGSIVVGQIGSSGNWGQAGKKSFGLQRIKSNGKAAFEPLAMRAMSDGFEVELTEPLAQGFGESPDEYEVQTWRYEPTGTYGGPKVDVEKIDLSGINISSDRKKLFLPIEKFKPGNVYYLRLPAEWKNDKGEPLWVTEAYYTLNAAPEGKPGPKIEKRPPANTLSDAETKDGWQLLFNGQDMSSFHNYKKTGVPVGWQSVDGTLTRIGTGGDLVTNEDYTDFELAIDWKVPEGGNSGLYYRADESQQFGWVTGPEMQMLDDARHPDGKNPKTSAGAAYAVFPPAVKMVRPAGSWNTAKLIVKGNHVEHWLNGQKVVDYELGSPAWRAAVDAGKFKDAKLYGSKPTGKIMLQDHGDAVAFRNIKVKRL